MSAAHDDQKTPAHRARTSLRNMPYASSYEREPMPRHSRAARLPATSRCRQRVDRVGRALEAAHHQPDDRGVALQLGGDRPGQPPRPLQRGRRVDAAVGPPAGLLIKLPRAPLIRWARRARAR